MFDDNRKARRRGAAVSEADRRLFRDSVGPVRPVRDDRVGYRVPPPVPRARFTEADERAVVAELLEAPADPGRLESGEYLLFHRSGVSPRILRRLRRGGFAVQDELDLHRLNEAAAETLLLEFLRENRSQGRRCVKIITGKGLRSRNGPVLRRMAERLLPRLNEVLAFCSAVPGDGGTGALYVLLRR